MPRGHDPDLVAAALWRAGAEGVWVRPREIVGYFPGPPTAMDHDDRAGLPDGVTWQHEPVVDHLAAWRESTPVVEAGRIDVVPHHHADTHRVAAGRQRILLDPGQAFGSGHHATTSGCLEALSRLANDGELAGRRVLDIGTGTGILAIAARLLGAGPVLGVDTDPEAITMAARNAADNGVKVDLRVGTVGGGQAGTGGAVHDVVLANLLTHTLVDLADDLAAATRTGGWLVASGVGQARGDMVADALRRAGFVDIEVRTHDDWVVLVGRRADDDPTGPDGETGPRADHLDDLPGSSAG